MQVMMFVTDDGKSPEGTGPSLFVADAPGAVLPPHPRGLFWKYFATFGLDDAIFGPDREAIAAAMGQGRPFISPRLVYIPSAQS